MPSLREDQAYRVDLDVQALKECHEGAILLKFGVVSSLVHGFTEALRDR